MSKPCSRTIVISIVLAVVISAGFISPIPAQASTIMPRMTVTLISGNSTYAATVFVGKPLTITAQVKNTGNVPLRVTANDPTAPNWDLEDRSSDCPESLAVSKTCMLTWEFSPQVDGQVYLRVYARGYFTTSTGATSRITQSPAFIFNVKPPKGSTSTSGSSGSSTTTTSSNLPKMAVTLVSGGSTYASTVFAGKPLVFQAQVKNIGGLPLGVSANLTVPIGWDLDADKSSDCPTSLGVRKTCTVTWNFTPQAEGQVFLRVYVRGTYTLSSGTSNRITQAPAFIFNVKPPKVTE